MEECFVWQLRDTVNRDLSLLRATLAIAVRECKGNALNA
jgi:hypothetical protein